MSDSGSTGSDSTDVAAGPADALPIPASVIIPCVRIEPLVIKCVRECRRCGPDVDIIVVSDDPDVDGQLDGQARVIVSGSQTIGAKRNIGANESAQDYLAFIDSDAFPETDWLRNAASHLAGDDTLGAVGGPNVSPPDEPLQELYAGNALRSVLVSAKGYYRKTVLPARYVVDLPSCNLIVRREEYLSTGGMNEALFTGEDIDFCTRLVGRGRRILYTPDVLVYHKNRAFRGFVKQRLTYGASVPRLIRRHSELRLAYVVAPAIFILFLASIVLAVWMPDWAWIYGAVLVVYGITVLFEAVRVSHRTVEVPGTILALLIGNLVPGIGTILQYLRLLPDLRGIYKNHE